MLLFQEIAEYFKHEGHVIAQAPFTFTIALILVGGAIYWFVNGHYDERIKTLEARVGFETSRADHADISGIEQRFVEEAVGGTAVERGKTFILRGEPIPQTVQLTV